MQFVSVSKFANTFNTAQPPPPQIDNAAVPPVLIPPELCLTNAEGVLLVTSLGENREKAKKGKTDAATTSKDW